MAFFDDGKPQAQVVQPIWWAACPKCSHAGWQFAPTDGPSSLLCINPECDACQLTESGWQLLMAIGDYRSSSLITAYNAARQARFETQEKLEINEDGRKVLRVPRYIEDAEERAMELDRAHFRKNPHASEYIRSYFAGEFFPRIFPKETMILVKNLTDGIRSRHPLASSDDAVIYPGYENIVEETPILPKEQVQKLEDAARDVGRENLPPSSS